MGGACQQLGMQVVESNRTDWCWAKPGHLGVVLGLSGWGWVASMSLLRSDGRFDVAVFRGSVPVPVPVPLCLWSVSGSASVSVFCVCVCVCVLMRRGAGNARLSVPSPPFLERRAKGKRADNCLQQECRCRNVVVLQTFFFSGILSAFGDPGPAACLRARNRKPFSQTQKAGLSGWAA